MAPVFACGFLEDLSSAVGYRKPFELLSSKLESFGPIATEAAWSALEPLLRKAAIAFREKHKRTPVLVIDAADRIAQQDAKLFSHVQDFAKECADNNTLLVVFVFSDGTPPPVFILASAVSRAICPVEVGDISDAAAINFLKTAYGKDEKTATEIVETISGGRFPLLQELALWEGSLQEWRSARFVQVSDTLNDVNLEPTHDFFKELLAAAKAKLALELDKAHTLLEKTKVQVLLKENVIAPHPDNTYTFHSRYIMDFIIRHVEPAQQKAKTELV